MGHTYGYCRISTSKQSISRQIENISSKYPDAIIIEEVFSGTTLDRPKWAKLYKNLQAGDTVVFDEISRMSRDADEGFVAYKDLYDRGVNLIFLKESALDTENFRSTQQIATTGDEIADIYIEATNRVLMILAQQQIRKAFETAQHEVDFLHQRTREGVQNALKRYRQESMLGIPHKKKQVGRQPGCTLATSKQKAAKLVILKHSRDFNGTLEDKDVIVLAKVSKGSYYRYKAQLRSEESRV